jgi:hypothetical protein
VRRNFGGNSFFGPDTYLYFVLGNGKAVRPLTPPLPTYSAIAFADLGCRLLDGANSLAERYYGDRIGPAMLTD